MVERDLGQERPKRDAAAVFNLGSSGGSNVARDKDTLVGQAVAAVRAQSRFAVFRFGRARRHAFEVVR